MKKRQKQYEIDNIDAIKENKRQYYFNNAETMRERQRQYYFDNNEVVKEGKRWYYKDNIEIVRQYKKENAGAIREYQGRYCKTRRKSDPLFAFIGNTRNLINISLKNRGYKKSSKTAQLLGCSYADFLLHIGPKPSETAQLDHICPCAQAVNEQELIKLQHFSNFQWLEATPNLIKSDSKTPEGEVICLKLLNRPWLSDDELKIQKAQNNLSKGSKLDKV
jgi:hypothetical protein